MTQFKDLILSWDASIKKRMKLVNIIDSQMWGVIKWERMYNSGHVELEPSIIVFMWYK